MKVSVIGIGSYVFGPAFLHDMIVEHRLGGIELALVDVDPRILELMAGVGRRMAESAGVEVKITPHTDRAAAMEGADFVVCAAAIQMRARFLQDVQIIRRRAPEHLITEFGGLAGLSSSIRQIALIEQIVGDMQRHCPRAMLLTVSNPLPRVCQAAHQLGIPTVGFCSNSLSGYAMVWKMLHGQRLDYPLAPARERYEMVMAGVNHLTFTLRIEDRQTGRDIQPEIVERIRAGTLSLEGPITRRLVMETGCLATNGDAHMQDFLVPQEGSHSMDSTQHGTAGEREGRLRLLSDVAQGRQSYEGLMRHRAWERPADLIAAQFVGRQAAVHSLNLVNEGQIPQLPQGVFVETPAALDGRRMIPRPCELPEAVVRYCRPTAEMHDCIVSAALARDRGKLQEAVERDPTILDKALGRQVLDDLLTAHADLVGAYQ